MKLQPLIQTPMFSIATLWPFKQTAHGQVPQRRDVSLLSPLWPWGEEAATEGEERPESRTQSRWRTPWMTELTPPTYDIELRGNEFKGLVDRVKCALKDGATKMPVGLQKNDQKIVHEIWPTEVECKCYKWSRLFWRG